jgi:hypothetical protein
LQELCRAYRDLPALVAAPLLLVLLLAEAGTTGDDQVLVRFLAVVKVRPRLHTKGRDPLTSDKNGYRIGTRTFAS